MTRRHVYPWLGALCLTLPMPALAGPGAGAGGGGGIGSGAVIEALWDWGEPAIEGARELKSGLIGEASPDLTLPGEVGVQVLVPNDLPLNRAYQVRLRGTLEDAQGKPLALNPVLGTWQPFDPRLEQVEAAFTWSPAGLTKGDVGPLQATLIAEVALVTAGAGEVIIESEPFQVPIRLMLASALGEIKISEGGAIEEEDPESPLYGARLELPPGAFDGSGTVTAALLPARQLPYHEGFRAWLGQPAEVRLSRAEAPSAAMTLRLPTLGGEAPGMTYWDPEAAAYRFEAAVHVGPDFVTVSNARSTLWGPSPEEQDTYIFHLDLGSEGSSPLESDLCDHSCPEDEPFLKADTRTLLQMPSHTLTAALLDELGRPVLLGPGSEAGKCLEATWGAQRLQPLGSVFGAGDLLPGLDNLTEDPCNGSVSLSGPALDLALTHAQVPGWAEFVSWVVPPEGALYSGTPPETCSEETLTALWHYLSVYPTATSPSPGGSGVGDPVTLAPLIFDCLWLRLDPSVDSAEATFDGDGRPTAIDATLPGALDAEQAAAFAADTAGTLLRWRSGAEGAPTSPEEAEAQLLAACEAGSLPPSVGIISLGAPTQVSGDALHFTLPADAGWATGDEISVSVLRLTQADDGTSSACAQVPWRIDADGDGFALNAWESGQRDCDDTDATIFPGATELCDDVDQDCDENPANGVTLDFYPDGDGDGHGTAVDGSPKVQACEAPAGFASLHDDCDDTQAEVYPGAEERCDGLDNDCDARADEDAEFSLYRDEDGDGFGAGASVFRCREPGWVEAGGDCDDSDPAQRPDAPTMPALARDGSGLRYFGCDPASAIPTLALDGQAPDALWIPAGASIQAVLDALPTMDAYLMAHDLQDRFATPSALKLGPGTFLERLRVAERALRIEGTASPEGPLTVLNGQRSLCAWEGEEVCSTLLVLYSPELRLRSLQIEEGGGTPYHRLSPRPSTIDVTYGGAIAAIGSHLALEDVHILGSEANVGAGLALLGADTSLHMEGSEVAFNAGISREGVPFAGALYLEKGAATLFDNEIHDNTQGTGIEGALGAGLTAINVDLVARSNRIFDNEGPGGAGVLVVSTESGRDVSLINNAILGNVAASSGGGLSLLMDENTAAERWILQGNVIAENVAELGFGGGLSLSGAATLRNNVLSENYAGLGGGGLSYVGEVPLQVSQSIFDGNGQESGAALPQAPDILFYGAGVETAASILLPAAGESLSCGVSHDDSGYFGVDSAQPVGCASPETLGRILPPEGASSPFVAYGHNMPMENRDWRLRAGTLVDFWGPDTQPTGAAPSPARMQEESAAYLGVHGGAMGGYGVGALVPSCVGGESVKWWEGGAVSGTFGRTDAEARSASASLSAQDNLLFFGEAGDALRLEIGGVGGATRVEVLRAQDGACVADGALGPVVVEGNDDLRYDLAQTGVYLLRVAPEAPGLSAYTLNLTLTQPPRP